MQGGPIGLAAYLLIFQKNGLDFSSGGRLLYPVLLVASFLNTVP
ncbi:hypothetical protein ATPR_2945 [Acetobacter tropicalis NBRC 101654]|uniref:Uncharacterized protein n=1 Tax=Acetobacter tropicalis NBRC 101654 TaxID=749388 RepID=F7VHU6_9PROT|nr:hypothetical protein ATPR_2945 [Acetobacter tropicalis NBRC 101654]